MVFNGFNESMLHFLVENKLNNSKLWFDEHKAVYNESVLTPLKELVCDLSSCALEIDPLIDVTPSINKTISRVYRDTRFSKDKSLYRDNMWIVFMRQKKTWPDYPAFYFEVYPTSYRYGMGYYIASKEAMQLYREFINNNNPSFQKAISCYEKQDTFKLLGDKYKRTLDASKPDNIKEWYDRKTIYFEHSSTDLSKIFSKNIIPEIISGFNILKPIYTFLCSVENMKPKF